MDDNKSKNYQVNQREVPWISLLPPNILPPRFKYPSEYLWLINRRLVFLNPWMLCSIDEVEIRYRGLQKRYPNRTLVPFARRFDNDDVACWENDDNKRVVVVHDFASSGWEDTGEFYPNFWAWFKAVVDDMIEYQSNFEDGELL